MNKSIIIVIGIVVVISIVAAIYGFMQSQNGTSNVPAYGTTPTPPSTPTITPSPQVPVATPTTHNVSIQSFAFSQKSINIKNGDTVVWTNKDSAPHTVTGGNGGPASGTLNNGGTYSFTFNSTGTFNYKCAIHPSMTATVTVTE